MIKVVKYFCQSIMIYFFFILGRIIGLKLSRKIFAKIFAIFAPIFKSKKIIERNLNTFSSDLSDSQKNKIKERMWNNYGMTFIEYIFLDKFRKSNTYVQFDGEENLLDIIRDQRQAIYVSGHFSNFELMSMEISKKKIKLATIYRPLNNFFLNPMMEFLRRRYVCNNQIKKGINGVREAIDYIKKGYSIALMIDQRVSEGEKINFFGKPALTTTLPAQLSKKYNLPIIPVFIERINNHNFKIKFYKAINFNDYGNKITLSEKLNAVLEKMIKENPNEWIWTHNRWK